MDSSKGPQVKKVKNRFHQKFITNRHPGHTYLLLRVVMNINIFRIGHMLNNIKNHVFIFLRYFLTD
ncbi:hypothetical protein [Lactobacillus sp. ESL0245]|uniref:hypothetical protein n=1 Tax=Lactobacillus sp. ESL0245 TaxID=2069358 RepID=UPI0011C3C83F|nr:hypothetical protein [Lactobacillus sp. ESL0245]